MQVARSVVGRLLDKRGKLAPSNVPRWVYTYILSTECVVWIVWTWYYHTNRFWGLEIEFILETNVFQIELALARSVEARSPARTVKDIKIKTQSGSSSIRADPRRERIWGFARTTNFHYPSYLCVVHKETPLKTASAFRAQCDHPKIQPISTFRKILCYG